MEIYHCLPNYWILMSSRGETAAVLSCIPTDEPTRLQWIARNHKWFLSNRTGHKTKGMNVEMGFEEGGEPEKGQRQIRQGDRDQNNLYTCVKLSKNTFNKSYTKWWERKGIEPMAFPKIPSYCNNGLHRSPIIHIRAMQLWMVPKTQFWEVSLPWDGFISGAFPLLCPWFHTSIPNKLSGCFEG